MARNLDDHNRRKDVFDVIFTKNKATAEGGDR